MSKWISADATIIEDDGHDSAQVVWIGEGDEVLKRDYILRDGRYYVNADELGDDTAWKLVAGASRIQRGVRNDYMERVVK